MYDTKIIHPNKTFNYREEEEEKAPSAEARLLYNEPSLCSSGSETHPAHSDKTKHFVFSFWQIKINENTLTQKKIQEPNS